MSRRLRGKGTGSRTPGWHIPFDNPVSIDTVRFFTDGLNQQNFASRSIDNVDIRRQIPHLEPRRRLTDPVNPANCFGKGSLHEFPGGSVSNLKKES